MNNTVYDSQAVANGVGSIPGADYPFPAHHGGAVAIQNAVYPPYGGAPGAVAVNAAFPSPLPSAATPLVALQQQPQQRQVQQQQQAAAPIAWDPVQQQQVGGTMPRVIPQGSRALSVACPSPFGPAPGLKSPTSTQCFNSHTMSYLNDSDGAEGRNAFPLSFHHDPDHSPFGALKGDAWSIANTDINGSIDLNAAAGTDAVALGAPRPNRCPMMKLLNINNADTPNMTCPMRGLFHNAAPSGPRPMNNVNVAQHPLSALMPSSGSHHGTIPPALAAVANRSMNGAHGEQSVSYPAAAALPGPSGSTVSTNTATSAAGTDDEDGDDDEDDDLNRKRRKSICYTNRQQPARSGGRKRPLKEFVGNNNDDALYAEDGSDGGGEEEEVEEEKYPEVGVRATATIQVAKEVFVDHQAMHRGIAREMMLEGLRQIAEYRWIHEKYDIDKGTVRYLVFLDEDLKIPIEFEEIKPKRGRPPKHKKARTNEDGKDMKEYNEDPKHDKLYRLNFQIIFEHGVPEQERMEIVQCIKIDLNPASLSMLLSTVLSAKIGVTGRVQAYSLYAVEAGKLKEYERYETEEEARKKKKREREQKRRESKKKGMRQGQSS